MRSTNYRQPFMAGKAIPTTGHVAGQTLITRTVETSDDEPAMDVDLRAHGQARPFLSTQARPVTGMWRPRP